MEGCGPLLGPDPNIAYIKLRTASNQFGRVLIGKEIKSNAIQKKPESINPSSTSTARSGVCLGSEYLKIVANVCKVGVDD